MLFVRKSAVNRTVTLTLVIGACVGLANAIAGPSAALQLVGAASPIPSPTRATRSDSRVEIAIAGPDEMVLPAEKFTCGAKDPTASVVARVDVPDAPPRMWRRADGTFELIAAEPNNRPWFSRDGRRFYRADCSSAFKSQFSADPSKYADQDWLTAIYTTNGRDVFGIIHDEYHGAGHIPACRSRLAPGQGDGAPICLSIGLTGAISHDGGSHFSPLPNGLRIVAAPQAPISDENAPQFTQTGIRDPSNIVRNPADGYFYILAVAVKSGNQLAGTCLFRSADPGGASWFAWDGANFTTQMTSPYLSGATSTQRLCRPILAANASISTISYNTAIHEFIAVGKSTDRNIIAQTSADLIHWKTPQNLRRSVQDNWWRPGVGDPDPDSYYSIIDPDSPSLYYDVSGAHPYVYFVHWRVNRSKVLSHVRDIERFPLSIALK